MFVELAERALDSDCLKDDLRQRTLFYRLDFGLEFWWVWICVGLRERFKLFMWEWDVIRFGLVVFVWLSWDLILYVRGCLGLHVLFVGACDSALFSWVPYGFLNSFSCTVSPSAPVAQALHDYGVCFACLWSMRGWFDIRFWWIPCLCIICRICFKSVALSITHVTLSFIFAPILSLSLLCLRSNWMLKINSLGASM